MIDRLVADLKKIEGIKHVGIIEGKNPIVSDLPPEESATLSEILKDIYGVSDETAKSTEMGNLKQILISGLEGKMIIAKSGNFLVGVITETKVNLGLIRLKLKSILKELKGEKK
jgi:predicted regulator of Ras-like GTPase activity (Roadblock/LC7/MglB family)